MKLRSTTPASNLSFAMRAGIVVSLVVMAVALPMQFFASQPASADAYDAKIQVLRNRIANYEDEASALRDKADTLQNALNVISNDKAKIQTEVDLYQAEYDKLVAEIKATEERIAENRKTSGDLIVTSSLSNDVPLIVRLASSDNLADYIDGEASRIAVRDSIVQKTEENEKLKDSLKEKQAQTKKLLDDVTFKRNELAAKEAEQQRLVDDTKGSEEAYRNMISAAQDDIIKIQAEQQAAYERARAAWEAGGGSYITRGGSGGYYWANAYWNYSIGYSTVVDDWGLFARQCTSYVAWKLDQKGYGVRHFQGRGHAYEWPSTTGNWRDGNGNKLVTQSYGSNPKVGDAAVIPKSYPNFPYGHVMYVEAVYADGSIAISEYNFAGPGIYSERMIPPGQYRNYTFLTFSSR